jgi:hypothetical protein
MRNFSCRSSMSHVGLKASTMEKAPTAHRFEHGIVIHALLFLAAYGIGGGCTCYCFEAHGAEPGCTCSDCCSGFSVRCLSCSRSGAVVIGAAQDTRAAACSRRSAQGAFPWPTVIRHYFVFLVFFFLDVFIGPVSSQHHLVSVESLVATSSRKGTKSGLGISQR